VSEFDDIDYGTWQGLSHDEAKQRWPEQFSLWTSAPDCMVFPNGESLAELAARVWGGMQQVLQKTKAASDAVVVVAHDSTNRALLMQILGMHLRFYRALAQDPVLSQRGRLAGARRAGAPVERDRSPARNVRESHAVPGVWIAGPRASLTSRDANRCVDLRAQTPRRQYPKLLTNNKQHVSGDAFRSMRGAIMRRS
jgi:hypothetical protein